MKTLIKKLLRESFDVETKDKDIVCDNCGWGWNKKDSKKSDLYICHECGHDNEPPYDDDKLNESEDEQQVAGVLIKCLKTGRVFLLYRNDPTPKWALMSGGMDEGEKPVDTLRREIGEELQIDASSIQFEYDRTEYIPEKNRKFYYYKGFTMSEFKPTLDHENLKSGWFSKDKIPTPLYKGLNEKITRI
jgi:8-oxo-dGTP pyrophosphatase MutT (NUDIX family)